MKSWRQLTQRFAPDDQPCELEYVGFWSRALAGMIDVGLLVALAMPLWQPLLHLAGPGADGLVRMEFSDLAWLLLSGLAALLFYLAPGSTPGKRAISAVVVDERTGCPPALAQQLGRSLCLLLSAAPLGLGFLWIAFHPKKQGWHDKLSGTLVVRECRRRRTLAHAPTAGASASAAAASRMTAVRNAPPAEHETAPFPRR